MIDMDNKRVIVILLLITIILSVVSVVLTLSVNLPELRRPSQQPDNPSDDLDNSVGQISLVVQKPGAG